MEPLVARRKRLLTKWRKIVDKKVMEFVALREERGKCVWWQLTKKRELDQKIWAAFNALNDAVMMYAEAYKIGRKNEQLCGASDVAGDRSE